MPEDSEMKFFPLFELKGENYLDIIRNRDKWAISAEIDKQTPPVVSCVPADVTLWKAIDVAFEQHLRTAPQQQRSFMFVVVEKFVMGEKESWRKVGWGMQQTPFPYQKTSCSMRVDRDQKDGRPEVVVSDMVLERMDPEGRTVKFKVLKVEGVEESHSKVHLLKRVWKNQTGCGVRFGFTPADPFAIQVQENKTLITVEGLEEINGTHVVTSTLSSSGSFYVDQKREGEGEAATTTSGSTVEIYNIDQATGPRPIFRERFVVNPYHCVYHVWPTGEWAMPPPRAPLPGEMGWAGSQPAESPTHQDLMPGGSVPVPASSGSVKYEDIDFPLRRAISPPTQEVNRLSVLEDAPVSVNRATSVASRASSDQPCTMQERVLCQMKAIQGFTRVLREGLINVANDILPPDLDAEKLADLLLSEVSDLGEHINQRGSHFLLNHEPVVTAIKQQICREFQNPTISPVFHNALDRHYKELPNIGLSVVTREMEVLPGKGKEASPHPQAFGSPAESPVGVEESEGEGEELKQLFLSTPESIEVFVKAVREWYGPKRVLEVCDPGTLSNTAVVVLGKPQVSILMEHVEEQVGSSSRMDRRGLGGLGGGTSETGRDVSERSGAGIEVRERGGATESSMEFRNKLDMEQLREQLRNAGDGTGGLSMHSGLPGSVGAGLGGRGNGSIGGGSETGLGNPGIGGMEGAGMSGGIRIGGLPGSAKLGGIGGSSGLRIGSGLGQAGIGGGAGISALGAGVPLGQRGIGGGAIGGVGIGGGAIGGGGIGGGGIGGGGIGGLGGGIGGLGVGGLGLGGAPGAGRVGSAADLSREQDYMAMYHSMQSYRKR